MKLRISKNIVHASRFMAVDSLASVEDGGTRGRVVPMISSPVVASSLVSFSVGIENVSRLLEITSDLLLHENLCCKDGRLYRVQFTANPKQQSEVGRSGRKK